MAKDYGPRPNIEHHHHIEDLIAGQSKRTDERLYFREKAKALEERDESIKAAKWQEVMDYACRCGTEFACLSVKQVEVDWSNPAQFIAFYKSKCRTCGNWCIRLITDKQKDGYWSRSRFVSLQRGMFHKDLIQPHEENFNLLYGKPR